jgi:hypothetical protein
LDIPEDIRAIAAGLAHAVRLEGARVDEQPNVWGSARDAQPASAYLPTPPCDANAPWFRVEASWPGGGWRHTARFNDNHAAYSWAIARTIHRSEVNVLVEQFDAESCALLSAQADEAAAADLQLDDEKNSGAWDRQREERAYRAVFDDNLRHAQELFPGLR